VNKISSFIASYTTFNILKRIYIQIKILVKLANKFIQLDLRLVILQLSLRIFI